MKTIGQRLTHAMNVRGLGTNEIDRKAGLVKKDPKTGQPTDRGSGYTSRLSRDQRKHPHHDIVHQIAQVLDVRFEWLMFGTGQMDLDDENEVSAFAAGVEASLKTAKPRTRTGTELSDKFEDAIRYWRHQVSDEAIGRFRAKSVSKDLSTDELGEMLLEEQRLLNQELAAKRAANKQAVAEDKKKVEEQAKQPAVTTPRRKASGH